MNDLVDKLYQQEKTTHDLTALQLCVLQCRNSVLQDKAAEQLAFLDANVASLDAVLDEKNVKIAKLEAAMSADELTIYVCTGCRTHQPGDPGEVFSCMSCGDSMEEVLYVPAFQLALKNEALVLAQEVVDDEDGKISLILKLESALKAVGKDV